MIKQILVLAQQCAQVNILARAKDDGTLSLTFVPTLKEGGDPALAKPFVLTGTPEELESQLPTALASIAEQRNSVAEQAAATVAVLEVSKKEIAEKGANALKGKTSAKPGSTAAASKAASAAGGDFEEQEDPDDDAPAPAAGQQSAASTSAGGETPAPMNLFT